MNGKANIQCPECNEVIATDRTDHTTQAAWCVRCGHVFRYDDTTPLSKPPQLEVDEANKTITLQPSGMIYLFIPLLFVPVAPYIFPEHFTDFEMIVCAIAWIIVLYICAIMIVNRKQFAVEGDYLV